MSFQDEIYSDIVLQSKLKFQHVKVESNLIVETNANNMKYFCQNADCIKKSDHKNVVNAILILIINYGV